MMRYPALVVLVLIAACRPGPAPAPDRPVTSSRDAAVPGPRRVLADAPVTTLDGVATCFHRAVTLLQSEPAAGESLSAFFARAERRAAGPLHACFAGVKRNVAGAVVVGADAVVTVTRGAPSHDQYEGGRTELNTPYRFTAAGVPGSASTTINRSFGGSP